MPRAHPATPPPPLSGDKKFHVFLTHDWGEDENGTPQGNHLRIAKINRKLKDRGLVTWFDEDRMEGDITEQMCKGIDQSAAIIVFVTKRYMTKVHGEGYAGDDDNCKLEFGYAKNKLGIKRMVPVCMEKQAGYPSEWFGPVGMCFGNRLLEANFGGVQDDTEEFEEQMDNLFNHIARVVGSTSKGDGAPTPGTSQPPQSQSVPPPPTSAPSTPSWFSKVYPRPDDVEALEAGDPRSNQPFWQRHFKQVSLGVLLVVILVAVGAVMSGGSSNSANSPSSNTGPTSTPTSTQSPASSTSSPTSAPTVSPYVRYSGWKVLRTLEGHSLNVHSVAFSPDGATLATGSDDWTAKLWRISDGSLLRTLEGHSDWVRSVAFSPDGATLATGSGDRTAKLWRVSDGSLLRMLEGHSNEVRSVAFSPDGATLATGSDDFTAKLWRVSDGSLLRTLDGHNRWVFSVAFSPDGATLATGSGDRTAKLWGCQSPVC